MASKKKPKGALPFDIVEVDGKRVVGPSALATFGTEAQRRRARTLGVVTDEDEDDDDSGEITPTT